MVSLVEIVFLKRRMESVQMYKWLDVQMYKCTDVRVIMHHHPCRHRSDEDEHEDDEV